MIRRAARVDANQGEIVYTLRQMGCSVVSLAAVGKGVTDLLVGVSGKNLLIEVKDGSKPPRERKLTPDQVIFHAEWRGQIAKAESVDEAISIVNEARRT